MSSTESCPKDFGIDASLLAREWSLLHDLGLVAVSLPIAAQTLTTTGPIIIGIDEAGRGCVAGPVAAAATAWVFREPVGTGQNKSTCSKDLESHRVLEQLRDSKKLSEAKRSACAKWLASRSTPVLMKGPSKPPLYQAARHISASQHIEPDQLLRTRQALAGVGVEIVGCAIGEASPREIEELNVWEATQLAISRALSGLELPQEPVALFFDGNLACKLPAALHQVPLITMVKGDDQLRSVSAASILAKVWRDHALCDLDLSFPQYGFAKHKGYGTAAHIEAIRSHGMTAEHRPSFLRKALGQLPPNVL